MRAPDFWYGEAKGRDAAPTLQALAWPASLLYAAVGAAKQALAKPSRAPVPVICVGNVSVGGAGKTPVTRAIRARLFDRGVPAHTLSRGHGGRLKGPVRVDPAQHDAADVGDEPLLHAKDGPAWIARDRAAGAGAAVSAGAQAIVMDDGFQNFGLAKDLSLLVFDRAQGIGNGRVLPAGPLREPMSRALSRADAVVLMGEGPRLPKWLDGFTGPVLEARIAPLEPPPTGALVAFAGIGRPQKFFDLLAAGGAQIEEALPFPDHHVFTGADVAFLRRVAQERGARLVTTEKDFVRMPAALREGVTCVPVAARFTQPERLDALLSPVFGGG